MATTFLWLCKLYSIFLNNDSTEWLLDTSPEIIISVEAKSIVSQIGCNPIPLTSSHSTVQSHAAGSCIHTNPLNQQESSEPDPENGRKLCTGPVLPKHCRKIINNSPPLFAATWRDVNFFFYSGFLAGWRNYLCLYASNPLSCQRSSALSLHVFDISSLLCLINVLSVNVHIDVLSSEKFFFGTFGLQKWALQVKYKHDIYCILLHNSNLYCPPVNFDSCSLFHAWIIHHCPALCCTSCCFSFP